jgi:hypothetical protein
LYRRPHCHQDGGAVDKDTMGVMMETMAGFCETTLGPLNEVGDTVRCRRRRRDPRHPRRSRRR